MAVWYAVGLVSRSVGVPQACEGSECGGHLHAQPATPLPESVGGESSLIEKTGKILNEKQVKSTQIQSKSSLKKHIKVNLHDIQSKSK